MPRGRPTQEPKGKLVALRLSERQLTVLKERVRREGVSLSEALRRCLDEWASSRRTPPSRRPSPEEQKSFDQVFSLLGLRPTKPAQGRRSQRPR